jgi:uncharacterized protein
VSGQPGWPTRVGLALVRAYQVALSPWLGSNCRYHPSCSAYAADALSRFGLLQGSWLAARRVARCHPWCEGGVDPVPTRYRWWGKDPQDPAALR